MTQDERNVQESYLRVIGAVDHKQAFRPTVSKKMKQDLRIYTIQVTPKRSKKIRGTHIEIVGDNTIVMRGELIAAVVPPTSTVYADSFEVRMLQNKY